jgi:hypothetical protein
MIYGFDKYVGCEPYASRAIETKSEGTKRQFSYMVSKNLLVPLKVVYANLDHRIFPGDYVYIKHEDLAGNVGWAKDIDVEGETTVDGKPRTVVMVPIDKIMLVKREPVSEVKE